MRLAIEAIRPDGTGLSHRLRIEMLSIAQSPLDDPIAERVRYKAALPCLLVGVVHIDKATCPTVARYGPLGR